MSHPNEDLLRRGYEAFAAGDMAALDGLFADDIVWHVPGRNQLAGDYRGKEEVFGLFGKLVELTGGTFRLEVHDLLANDEHGVVLVETTGERDGRSVSDRGVNVLHIEDGKVTEFWNHAGEQYVLDEFWG